MKKLNDDVVQILSKRCFAPETFFDMKQICAILPSKFGLSAFEYARVYDDGTAIILYSNPDIAKYIISKELHVTAHVPKEIIDKEFWFMPDPNGPYSHVVQEIKYIANSNSLANYIRRHVGFYEMYSFWREEDQSIATNKFINMKEALEQYCLKFVDQSKNLILSVEEERFKLTKPMMPNFKGLDTDKKIASVNLHLYLEKVQQELIKLNTHIFPKLSVQELKCISFLIEGRTATDMADLLNLSHRTIEMHLNSTRIKLNCRRKSDIISTLVDFSKTIEQ